MRIDLKEFVELADEELKAAKINIKFRTIG